MIRRPRATAALAALGLAAALSVATTHAPEGCYVALEGDPATEDDDVVACEEQHWFHRATTHASNVGQVAEEHGLPTFDVNPPAGSVTGGNGGGYLSWSGPFIGNDDGVLDAPFVGTYTGVLDRLDIDLHLLASTYDRLNSALGVSVPHSIDIELTVNGAAVFSQADISVVSVPEESSQAGSTRLDVAITGLAALLDRFKMENGPDTVHDIELRIGPGPYGDQVYVLAFDTTEVPGGIGFNRVEIPEGTVVVSAG